MTPTHMARDRALAAILALTLATIAAVLLWGPVAEAHPTTPTESR